MNWAFIAAAFPVVAFVTPYLMQLIKMVITPAFVGKNVDYRMTMRLITGLVASIVGFCFLIFTHNTPSDPYNWLLFAVVVFAYGLGGGPAAMGVYSFINGFLSQSPGPLPPEPIVPKLKVGITNDQPHREPY